MQVLLVIFCLTLTGCSEKEGKDDKEQVIDKLAVEFDSKDKENYGNYVAMLVDGEPVHVDEVMWYIFLIEDSMKIYSDTYEKQTNEPYWDQVMNGTVTMGQMYTEDIKKQIIYNQVLWSKAVSEKIECDQEEIAKEAKENMSNISKEDIERYGLTEEAYVRMLTKWEMVDKYLKLIGSQAKIDEEEVRKENPIEEFKCKINTEFIIVMNTYVDANGEKQTHDDETIANLTIELENARKEVMSGKSMKEVAKAYDNVYYYQSSFYQGSSGATKIYENAAVELKTGEVSNLIRDALSSYVIRRLDDTKDSDYTEYIGEIVTKKQELYAQDKAKEYTNNAQVRVNDNVWKTIGVGKNNS